MCFGEEIVCSKRLRNFQVLGMNLCAACPIWCTRLASRGLVGDSHARWQLSLWGGEVVKRYICFGRYCSVILCHKYTKGQRIFESWREYSVELWFRSTQLIVQHTWMDEMKALLAALRTGHAAICTLWKWCSSLGTNLLQAKRSCSSGHYSYLHEQHVVDVPLHTECAVVVDAGMFLLAQTRDAGHRPPVNGESVLEPWPPTSRRR